MPTYQHNMTAKEFRATIKRLAFNNPARPDDEGISACARFFGYTERAGRIWADKGPPNAVALGLRLLTAAGWTALDAADALDPRRVARKR